ncbi:DUF7116 family protein [Halalkalicoccus jeotgali]|uniref:Uncharacterized protein n=1 Tax=Halalkalicoccus jeotgali (strain DSM 18796 / CECT 7217 / JCM 14584 / KCTC 4019 / B3) TaxID=795797 RepID=D8JAT8_HALJB|nr:hypothetical protein [Halalkalicoccus jeotgali]ADJ14810.1 hypothetical protein HacjB3_07115 [Halalkalicoccus jeotgali B3]ELY39392.1 hypothetical protein C497_05522 [Halalkalicoccus jeotgali B3]
MGPVSIPPVEQARSIFSELGYTLSGDGTEFRAEREWKVVHVTATTDEDEDSIPDSGSLRCFVTYREAAESLVRRLSDLKPDYEWAVISVTDGSGYDVVHAPSMRA